MVTSPASGYLFFPSMSVESFLELHSKLAERLLWVLTNVSIKGVLTQISFLGGWPVWSPDVHVGLKEE